MRRKVRACAHVCLTDVKLCRFFVTDAVSQSFPDSYAELETAVQLLSMAVFVLWLSPCVELYYINRCFDGPCLKVANHELFIIHSESWRRGREIRGSLTVRIFNIYILLNNRNGKQISSLLIYLIGIFFLLDSEAVLCNMLTFLNSVSQQSYHFFLFVKKNKLHPVFLLTRWRTFTRLGIYLYNLWNEWKSQQGFGVAVK